MRPNVGPFVMRLCSQRIPLGTPGLSSRCPHSRTSRHPRHFLTLLWPSLQSVTLSGLSNPGQPRAWTGDSLDANPVVTVPSGICTTRRGSPLNSGSEWSVETGPCFHSVPWWIVVASVSLTWIPVPVTRQLVQDAKNTMSAGLTVTWAHGERKPQQTPVFRRKRNKNFAQS